MNERLKLALDRLGAEGDSLVLPRELEATLLSEARHEIQHRRRRRISSWSFGVGTIAASIVAVVVAQNTKPSKHSAPPNPVEQVQESEQPFIGLPYITQPSPYDRIQVVRMEVPVAALIAAGLPMQGADPGARVEADVVVGQDGRARAVRLISNTRFN
jgi:hypothetical protein